MKRLAVAAVLPLALALTPLPAFASAATPDSPSVSAVSAIDTKSGTISMAQILQNIINSINSATNQGTGLPGDFGQFGAPGQNGSGQQFGQQFGQGFGLGDPFAQQNPTTSYDSQDATAEQSEGLVFISTQLDFGAGEAAGTGMILRNDGIVVTNHHVVQGATDIKVTDAETGQTYPAKVLGADATSDIAVLQLEGASNLNPVVLDTNGVQVGEQVTAVGDAGGSSDTLSAAPGEVTALDQRIEVSDEAGGSTPLTNLIKVTSDIIPGDSGGALRDANGEVVGMNVAASTGSDPDGYVIPIDQVEGVVNSILNNEQSANIDYGYPAFLGVSLPTDGSTTLAGVVDGGPAEQLGLAAGDTITAINDTAVTTGEKLSQAITSFNSGDQVTVHWTDSAGSEKSGTATLMDGPVA